MTAHKEALTRITRDDTEHGKEYYLASDVDALLAQQELCKYGQEPKSCTSSPMDCQCAIDATLAQPEQEPVAQKIWEEGAYGPEITELRDIPVGAFLYTTPPQRTWVGLTDEDYQILREGVVKQGKPLHWMIEHIEAKLKEKNT